MTPTIVFLVALAASEATPRFSGEAHLGAPVPASADRRFVLDATIAAGDTTQRAGRFELNGRLDAGTEAKSAAAAAAACGNDIFSDSFE